MRTAAALPLPEPAGDASGPEDRQLQLLSHLHPPLATGTVHLSHEFAPSAVSPAPQHQG